MAKAVADLRGRLPTVRPWAVVAIVLAITLLLYYGYQTRRYLDSSGQTAKAESEIKKLAYEMVDPIPPVEEIEGELEMRSLLLEEWRSVFRYEGYPETEPLLALVFDTAQETDINLSSMDVLNPEALGVGEPAGQNEEKIDFQSQGLALRATGDKLSDIYSFLSELHHKMPSVDIYDIRLEGFSGSPSAEIVLLFYLLAPEPVPEDEEGAE